MSYHIISPREKGPRHDPTYPQEKLDSDENLILLCRIHHKMVDDQEETYTRDILRQMKSNHGIWLTEKFTDKSHTPKPLKFLKFNKIFQISLHASLLGKK